jgi:hypothetical protein
MLQVAATCTAAVMGVLVVHKATRSTEVSKTTCNSLCRSIRGGLDTSTGELYNEVA